MPHQDHNRPTESPAHHQDLKRVFDWLLQDVDFAKARFRDLCSWTPRTLTAAALLWAWSDESTLTTRFQTARKIAIQAFGLTTVPARTYQAFLKLLRAWTAILAAALVQGLRRRMRRDLAERFEVEGWTVFGIDGSRLELPRTVSNEDRFASRPKPKPKPKRRRGRAQRRRPDARADADAAAVAKKINSPQMWLTVMFHLGTGLPWDWRQGPSNSSEREHLLQMIAALPAQALVTADAGFVGYKYSRAG